MHPLHRVTTAEEATPCERTLQFSYGCYVGQEGEHSPVDDARAALYLYHKHRKARRSHGFAF